MAPPGPPALAGERVIVVARDDVDTGVAEVVEAALRARGMRVLDQNERGGLDGKARRSVVGDRQEVRSRMLAARAAWRQLDLPAADDATAVALDEALRLERPEDHLDLLVDALVFRATVQLSRGATVEDVIDVMRLAARLEPLRVELDAALHPPSVVRVWVDARAANEAAQPAVVVVRPRVLGSDEPVSVLVDGVPWSTRDGLLRLPMGPHLLSVRAPGCHTRSRVLSVGSDVAAIEDVLQADADLVERSALVQRIRQGDQGALPELLRQTDVDVVVSVGANIRQAFAVRRGGIVADVVVTSTEGTDEPPVQLADAIVVALAPSKPLGVKPELPPDVDAEGAGVSWAVVGAAVGVVVVGTGLGVLIWAVVPGEPPADPVRPGVVTCCGP
jgi:hypothetical protein